MPLPSLNNPSNGLPLHSRAFSLIELTLAIAIVSIAFITMIGLVSSGLNTFHEGNTSTISSRIAQQIINSVQQTDYNHLAAGTYYYDDQGDQLATANKAQAAFQVNLTIANSTTLPGASANSNLATATVKVARYPGTLTLNWASPPAGVSIATYSTQVAKDY